MGELILNAPLLQGKSDIEQIHKIFSLVGSPTEQNWPKHTELPNLKRVGPYVRSILVSVICHLFVVCFPLRGGNRLYRFLILKVYKNERSKNGLQVVSTVLCFEVLLVKHRQNLPFENKLLSIAATA